MRLFASEGFLTPLGLDGDIMKIAQTPTHVDEHVLTVDVSNRKKWTADSTETLRSLLQTCV